MSFDQDQSEEVTMAAADLAQLVAERDALVKALKGLIRAGHGLNPASIEWNAAHAALAAAGAA